MAKLYVKSDDVNSRLPWLYALLTKCSDVELIHFNAEDSHQLLLNPTKSLPFLIHDDIRVFGGLAVCLYLAEKFASYTSYSKSLNEQVKYNSILFWSANTLYRQVLDNYVLPQIKEGCQLSAGDNEYLLEHGLKNTKDELTALEETYLSKTKYLCGDHEFIGDYYVALILMDLDKIQFDLSPWPKTKLWYDGMKLKIIDFLPS